ncbi:glycerophosphodiester phosphodiesterase [Ancylobacter sp. Lp-2]|uniref:glycerophosphodiester phosphodiesterase family protein n=1 Tax=Ancylobacter sp. Lp-2 TaxID=2881339 RepID=UPI001E4F29D5|nr:glycerophosphodiester phosphodiesterase family protein [Ancylobacter sp. Lp-2]MCB4771690.1 glycerophosphodiester phosphodiesterase [Ancylobacter sp. Lp-2]
MSRPLSIRLPLAALALSLFVAPLAAQEVSRLAEVGPRPFHLVDTMKDGPLKDQLAQCKGPFTTKNFSISHRGAPLQFPEHTREGYLAAAQMGAGVIECDVAFTKDRQLVCRHAQCDLHTTTDILARPELASKCSQGFQPADPATGRKASAKCCTSDLTLAEFKSLKPKMDAGNPAATTVADYMNSTPRWRTDLYVDRATLMSHKEYVELVKSLGLKFTPELKAPEVTMPFEGSYTQANYAQQLIDEYKAAGIDPKDVYAQSFQLDDVLYWLKNAPEFGAQAVYLDGRDETDTGFDNMKAESWKPSMQELADKGVKILAPPLWMLVTAKDGKIVPSLYAEEAKKAGLGLISWSLERSGPLKDGGGYYYQSIKSVTDRDGDTFALLDVLARDIGVIGVFSDWPATTTFYANCMKLN